MRIVTLKKILVVLGLAAIVAAFSTQFRAYLPTPRTVRAPQKLPPDFVPLKERTPERGRIQAVSPAERAGLVELLARTAGAPRSRVARSQATVRGWNFLLSSQLPKDSKLELLVFWKHEGQSYAERYAFRVDGPLTDVVWDGNKPGSGQMPFQVFLLADLAAQNQLTQDALAKLVEPTDLPGNPLARLSPAWRTWLGSRKILDYRRY